MTLASTKPIYYYLCPGCKTFALITLEKERDCPWCGSELSEQKDLDEAVDGLEGKLEMKVWSNEIQK